MDMKSLQRLSVIAATLVFSVSLARGQDGPELTALSGKVADWPAPETWSPQSEGRGISRMAAVTSPIPFIALAPCRIVDTRGNGAPIQGGMFTGGADVRNYAVAGICGIPAVAQALSLNFTVVGPTASGFLVSFPTGGAVPPTAILNFNAGDVRNNGAVVPLSVTTSFTVNVSAPTHVIIDVNGYYATAGVGANNTFLGTNAGNFTMVGDLNTGIGRGALSNNAAGNFNTATGAFALELNTTGDDNTADGEGALNLNDSGFGNTGIGTLALANNTVGTFNTAIGRLALFGNDMGNGNTAVGATALGDTTGTNNIGIGLDGGSHLTTGSNNICIGNSGVAGESGRIRIGTAGIQTATFITGISGVTSAGGVGVFVNGSGQLGTMTSSSRYKEDIRDIGKESDGLMKLRPVAFRYKPEIDPTELTQYGLIAEDVADVYPDLVVYDRDGKPETVRYHLVNALLLNEVQKQHREIEALKARLAEISR
jgi:endosialidase-like protein